MTDPARAQTVDTEIAKHCAFSLPGVALTLGRQNWHCLKDTYETLASDVQVGLRWIFTTHKKKACYLSLTLLHFIAAVTEKWQTRSHGLLITSAVQNVSVSVGTEGLQNVQ